MKLDSFPRKQHWVFLIVFSLCALLGFGSVLVGEIFLPDNPGGNQGRLAMYRSLGLGSLAWVGIAVWSASALWSFRTLRQK
ncbi:hypothetical protein [Gimesia fumaroli]|jgi:hypothetical protein|uniref:Uncharacterized protein n=1 Tax=Gimesia fumaroli TaxID=2527976 RepID=A0A518ILP7_9PLAN|nr:hypothetical protein [Gimesia fumaroli]QDV54014.1 hypothetical protein Enr17x_60970 [Gimesia fumaroli]